MHWSNGVSIARNELKQESFRGITTGRKLAALRPGSALLADFIEPMQITRYRVAKAIGVQQRRIDEICAGERGIKADTAVRLGLAFGIDPQFWLNLQAHFDIEVIQREQGTQLAEEVLRAGSMNDTAPAQSGAAIAFPVIQTASSIARRRRRSLPAALVRPSSPCVRPDPSFAGC